MKLSEQKQALADIFVSAAGPQTKLAARELGEAIIKLVLSSEG